MTESSPSPTEQTKDNPAQPFGAGRLVLLVEDEESLRGFLRLFLEKRGFQVVEAGRGDEAWGIWSENAMDFDLVITDMVMPGGVSGLDLANRISEVEPGFPIIFCSGYCQEVCKPGFRLEESQRFLQKPFLPAELMTTIRELLPRLG